MKPTPELFVSFTNTEPVPFVVAVSIEALVVIGAAVEVPIFPPDEINDNVDVFILCPVVCVTAAEPVDSTIN